MKKAVGNRHIVEIVVLAAIVIAVLAYLMLREKEVDKGAVVAKVDEMPIYKSEIEKKLATMLRPGVKADYNLISDNIKDRLVRDVATDKILLEKALKSEVTKNKEIEQEVKEFREAVYRREYLKKVATEQISDEEVRAEYDKLLKQVEGKDEVRASHILVKTEGDAKKALEALKTKSFEEVAKEFSIDKSNSDKGGDLGYFAEGQMVPEFAEAAFKMSKGEVSTVPVKTRYGYHIIRVEDKRPIKPLPYEEIKDKIIEEMIPLGAQRYIDGLVKDAKVELIGSSDKKEGEKAEAKPEETQAPVSSEAQVTEEKKEKEVTAESKSETEAPSETKSTEEVKATEEVKEVKDADKK